jgi:DNA-directed RNA polymerase subunit M/transcription elongation factor TFIIS
MNNRRLTCPNCQSRSVMYRKRRWYDGPLNFIETMLTGASVMRTNDGITPMAHSYMDPRFMERRQRDEFGRMMGRKTAELFWKCPDCKSKGEAFEEDLFQGPAPSGDRRF